MANFFFKYLILQVTETTVACKYGVQLHNINISYISISFIYVCYSQADTYVGII